jgi:uncharacterized protein (TIGR02145 family)/prepilin-type N-terminal cleavage/methylation domain-containing protein
MKKGFTIVELLVVIIVIGILAAITIISYTGISKKAEISSLKSDLANSSKQLNLFQVEKSTYPATISTNCSTNPTDATNLCIKSSSTNTYSYKYYSPNSYMLVSMNGNTCYSITNNSAPVENCVTIGTQTWMKYNLDVGDRINNTTTSQTNNSIIEKYCYDNDPANCNTYGGLYQWDEMMQYSTTEGIQGIAPTGFHIPSDDDYKTLEMYLGMDPSQVIYSGFRGTTEGDQLKNTGLCQGRIPCATSGFNWLPGGYQFGYNGVQSWYPPGSYGYLWTSSQFDVWTAFRRIVCTTSGQVNRNITEKTLGVSVRAIKN